MSTSNRFARQTTSRFELETFASATAGRKQRLAAVIFCAIASLGSIAILPGVTAPMPEMPAFLALNQCALVLVQGLTTWLFFSQYRRTRVPSLLVLGAGSLYTTLIVLAQLVCFPNVFRPGFMLGEGPATVTWLWNFWHLTLPLFAIPYAMMEGTAESGRPRKSGCHFRFWGP